MPLAFSPPCHSILDRPQRSFHRLSQSQIASAAVPGKDEYGRDLAFTGEGWKGAWDQTKDPRAAPVGLHPGRAQLDRMRGLHSQVGSIITHGTMHSRLPPHEGVANAKPPSNEMGSYFERCESTMPGDLLVRKTGVPIRARMAALIRQRSIDVNYLMTTFLRR